MEQTEPEPAHTTSEEESESEDENEDIDREDKIRMSDSVFLYPHKKLSERAQIFVGEISSGLLGSKPCAIKIPINPEDSVREAVVLQNLGPHSHVIYLYHSDDSSHGMLQGMYLVLEKCFRLDLYQYVTAPIDNAAMEKYSVARMGVKFCKQIIAGMLHVHDNLIIHKDLKPSNILLTHDLETVKIADFGCSVMLKSRSSMLRCTYGFGTLGYRPPEAFGDSYISLRTDCYSLGALFYFLLSNGGSPFGPDVDMWEFNSKHARIDIPDLQVPDVETATHLLKCMLFKDRCRRPSIWEIQDHPFWFGETINDKFRYGKARETEDNDIEAVDAAVNESLELDIEQDRRALPYIEMAVRMTSPNQDISQLPSLVRAESRPPPVLQRSVSQRDVGTQPMEYENIAVTWIDLTPSIRYDIRPIRDRARVHPAVKVQFDWEQELAVKFLENTVKQKLEAQKLLKLEKHANIVKIMDTGVYPGEPSRIYLVMERCLQNMSEYVGDNVFMLPKAMSFFQQSLSALEFIHIQRIIHFDLKPTNILIASDMWTIKISNFKISKDIFDDRSVVTISDHGGETGYNAPEVYRKDTHIGYKADIYSLALCGYYIFTHGKHPFGDIANERPVKIKSNSNPDLSHVPPFLLVRTDETADGKEHDQKRESIREAGRRNQLLNLFTRMLLHDPKMRPTACEIQKDEFLQDLPSHFPTAGGKL